MKKFMKSLKRIAMTLIIFIIVVIVSYWLWSPGAKVVDGRFDLGHNALWLQHGWLGDDSWFERNHRDKNKFRSEEKITELFKKLQGHNINILYPHLCPTTYQGQIPKVDEKQTKLFLKLAADYHLKVIPWVGGVFNAQVNLKSKKWRQIFINSIIELFTKYPQLAGIQLNIEPLPNGNNDFIVLLKELRKSYPKEKILSIAAYPPTTFLHPYKNVHWDMDYYTEMAPFVDQMAIMMYDSALKYSKVYQTIMKSWTKQLLTNDALQKNNVKILLGVPVYDDEETLYHNPKIENLYNALIGINGGLNSFSKLPASYQGIAIYCEWEMHNDEWNLLKKNYSKNKK